MELHVTKRKGREIVVLLDNDMRIVKPVYDYLKYQDQRDRAINTLIAYGNDLKAFWEFLSDYGYAYDEVSPKMIGEYKEYLMSEDDNIIAIDGIIALQDETGKVYTITPNGTPKLSYNSLSEYVEKSNFQVRRS